MEFIIINQVLLFLNFASSCFGPFIIMRCVASVRSMLILCSIKLMVACIWVAYFWWWFIGVILRSCKVGYWWPVALYNEGLVGFASSHILFVFLVFVPLCSHMSANSSIESQSPTSSENGDNDNINQISPTSFIAKPALSNTLDRSGSDHPCHLSVKGQISYAKAMKFGVGRAAHTSDPIPALRNHSPLLPSSTLPSNVIGDSPTLGLTPSPPAEHKEELIALCLLGKVWGNMFLCLSSLTKLSKIGSLLEVRLTILIWVITRYLSNLLTLRIKRWSGGRGLAM